MPTYVYKFVETGETIEIQQDFSDDTLTEAVHPVDGTMRPVKKVFLPVGITFKGGGFYKTDSKGSSSASTGSSSPDGSSTAGSSAGSDSSSGASAAPSASSSD
jgi:predicted nucleic acid-binding Zn ribbon protein